MAYVEPTTVIEIGSCNCCGKPVQHKVNVNGMVYYYCTPWEESPSACSHHEKWGKVASNLKKRAYLDAKKAHERKVIDDDRAGKELVAGGRPDQSQTENRADESQPEPVHEPQRSIVAGLAEYIRS